MVVRQAAPRAGRRGALVMLSGLRAPREPRDRADRGTGDKRNQRPAPISPPLTLPVEGGHCGPNGELGVIKPRRRAIPRGLRCPANARVHDRVGPRRRSLGTEPIFAPAGAYGITDFGRKGGRYGYRVRPDGVDEVLHPDIPEWSEAIPARDRLAAPGRRRPSGREAALGEAKRTSGSIRNDSASDVRRGSSG